MARVRARGANQGRAVLLTLLVALLAFAGGCSGSGASEDLIRALEQTRTAVRSAQLALDQVQAGSTTRAAAEVTVSDMADQISKAYQQAAAVPAESVEQETPRARTLETISDALTVVLSTEAALASDPAAAAVATARLEEIDTALGAALLSLGER